MESGDVSAPLLDADAATRLRRVINRLARAMNESSSAEDLSPTQASILGIVVARGEVKVSTLAAVEGLNPTMVSRMLTKLAERGLVERVPDGADARTVVAVATPDGRAMSERIQQLRVRALQQVAGGLLPATVDQLRSTLPALEEFAEAMQDSMSWQEPAR